MSPEERYKLIMAPADDPRVVALGMKPGAGDLLNLTPERVAELHARRAAEDGVRLARTLARVDPVALRVAQELLAEAAKVAKEAGIG